MAKRYAGPHRNDAEGRIKSLSVTFSEICEADPDPDQAAGRPEFRPVLYDKEQSEAFEVQSDHYGASRVNPIAQGCA